MYLRYARGEAEAGAHLKCRAVLDESNDVSACVEDYQLLHMHACRIPTHC